MADDSLEAEVERLRAEVEKYRQRELDNLKAQLSAIAVERDHYRQEAERNAEVGRQIHATAQEEIQHLRNQLEVKEKVALQLRRKNGRNTDS